MVPEFSLQDLEMVKGELTDTGLFVILSNCLKTRFASLQDAGEKKVGSQCFDELVHGRMSFQVILIPKLREQ